MSTIIRITSPRAGFRRGGIAHPAGTVDYPIEQFSDEQLDQIVHEALLTSEILDVEDGDLGADGKKQTPITPPGDDGRSDGANGHVAAAAGTAAAATDPNATGSTPGDGKANATPIGGSATNLAKGAKPAVKKAAKKTVTKTKAK